MSDKWTPPGYVDVVALVREHGKDKARSDLFSGRRRAFVWDRYTGSLEPIEPTSWCGREAEEHWLLGMRFTKGSDGRKTHEHCILVREDEQPPAPRPETSGTCRSPYMRLMLEANRHYGISEEQWPKKEVLEEYFRAQKLPDGTLVSPNLASQLATHCRPLAAKRGGNTKKG
jgi:hypothetical protein